MKDLKKTEHYKVIVIGGGQAGLSAGYFLLKQNIPFVILDANERVGDSWRKRWDSLHLFTPAKFDSLAGMPFPAHPNYFPTKNEMADYLESYAINFKLPVRSGTIVKSLSRNDKLYFIHTNNKDYTADHVIVAMSNFQIPKIPSFAKKLDPEIIQIHSFDYREPSQFQKGSVLVVGAGNSGAEIALEAVKNKHNVLLSGRDVGHIPFHIQSILAQLILVRLVIKFIFHRILTTNTFIGRKAKPEILSKGDPLIRIKPKEFVTAGIERVPKVIDVKDGKPLLENQRLLDVKNIVWSTGFYPSFSWVDIPVFKNGQPIQNRGVVEREPGLYFIGLLFLYALSSSMVHGVERDARYVVNKIAKRLKN